MTRCFSCYERRVTCGRFLFLLAALLGWSSTSKAEPVQIAESTHALARTVRVRLFAESSELAHTELRRLASRYGRLARDSENLVEMDVPPAEVDAVLGAIRGLGEVRSRRVTTRDISQRLERARGAWRVANASHERMLRMRATGVQDGLALERARNSAAREAEHRRILVRQLEQRTTVTRIRIDLTLPQTERIQPTELPIPWLESIGPASLHDPSRIKRKRYRELRNYFDGALRLEGVHADKAGELPENLNAVNAALSMRAMGEATPIGIFGGVDAALGGGSGFSYELQLMIGLGVVIGERFGIGVSSGPGVEGVTTTVPFGVTFPIEVAASIDLTHLIATKLTLREGWVVAADERKQGSNLAPFGDELSGALHVVVANRDREGGYSEARDGFELGFEYRELMGARAYIVTIGYAGHISDFSGRL